MERGPPRARARGGKGRCFLSSENALARNGPAAHAACSRARRAQAAFKKADVDRSGFITREELPTLLGEVYHGEAPKCEVDRIMAATDTDGDHKISFDEFMALIQHLKAEAHQRYKDAKGEVSSGSEFQSGELYRHHIRRHTRMTHAPNGKYSQPLTAAQDVGWSAHEAELIPPTAPKQSCAETVYAAELIKSGVFY